MPRRQHDGSVLKEWWESTTDTLSDLKKFWRQRQRILCEPMLAIEDNRQLQYKPLKFALHMIIVPALAVGIVGTMLKYVTQLPPLLLEREIATVEKAKSIATEAGQGGASLKMPDLFDKDFQRKLDMLKEQDEKEDNALNDTIKDLPFEIKVALSFAPLGTLDPAGEDQTATSRTQQCGHSLTQSAALHGPHGTDSACYRSDFPSCRGNLVSSFFVAI